MTELTTFGISPDEMAELKSHFILWVQEVYEGNDERIEELTEAIHAEEVLIGLVDEKKEDHRTVSIHSPDSQPTAPGKGVSHEKDVPIQPRESPLRSQ